MRTDEIKLGSVYRMGATDVQIVSRFIRGWLCRNLRTGSLLRVRSAKVFRFEVQAEPVQVAPDFKSKAAGERDE